MSQTPAQSDLSGIAIIGMAGRFPGARNLQQFWQNLVNGADTITRFREDELEFSVATPALKAQGQTFIRARGVLDDVGQFDAAFFGILPREAEVMDPQHRLFLECAWEALETAGYDPGAFAGMIGVYAGTSLNTYLLYNLCRDRAFAASFAGQFQTGSYHTLFGNDKDFLPTRVSYKLNLRGPSMAIQSACSTSLVAVVQACNALLDYQCDMALAGGVSISFPQKRDYLYQEEAMVSGDGTCRTFDAAACGTVFGHGVGIVLLKRLQDALADGDHVLAVIKGTALNNDGAAKVGYAAPSVSAQTDVIAMAQASAGIDPETISYIEAHGTGTPLGDPIEIAALTRAFRRGGAKRSGYCAIGTAKTNVGHLDAAAGVTGLIKTVLQFQHGLIPPILHFRSPNPKIDFAGSPFYPVTTVLEWTRGATPRRAGVSAFGVGGTNAHVVLEEPPVSEQAGESRTQELLVLSARSETALQRMSENLAEWLETNVVPDASKSLADVAFTLQVGRKHFLHRRALVARDAAEAASALKSADARHAATARVSQREPSVVFLFPGQGAQYVGMGRELYESEPLFRAEVDRCAIILHPHLTFDIRAVLYPDATSRDKAEKDINETWATQPSIFVVEYALARLWMSWGVKPSVLIGHSIGEYVAAVLAETFSLEDALKLLANRARLMQALPGGSMMAVRREAKAIESMLPPGASIAAYNSPSLCTVSGPTALLQQLHTRLDEERIAARLLPTSHAFHSAMMDPIVEPFTELVRDTHRQAPRLPWVSTSTGRWMTPGDMADASYWGRQLRHAVRFAEALEAVIGDSQHLLLEVGPGHTLGQLARQHSGRAAEVVVLSTLGPTCEEGKDLASMLASLGQLWLAGVKPAWAALYHGERRRRVPLPTYPFERERHWIEAERPGAAADPSSASGPHPIAFAAENATPMPVANASPAVHTQTGNPMASAATDTSSPTRRERLIGQLKTTIKELSGIEVSDDKASFMELGLDSLFLTQASQAFQSQFGVKITFRQMFDDLSTVAALASHLDKELPPDAFAEAPEPGPAATIAPPAPSSAAVAGGSAIEQLLAQQVQLMQVLVGQQRAGAPSPAAVAPANSLPAVRWPSATPPTSTAHGPQQEFKRFGPYKPIEKGEKGGLTSRQQEAVDNLLARYLKKTGGSKRYTAEHRPHFADPRAVSGFRSNWKEMVYPIVSSRSKGSKIWDVDGNEYIDITMGFGTHFFGHSPDWILDAVRRQLDTGMEIGPQSPLAGEVARLVCEFTGMDRATFCNTGSEAVMAAIRLSRTVTGRKRVVYFTGDYHGMFEEVLVRGAWLDGEYRAQPIAPGIPQNLAENMLVLEYGANESLEIIKAHAKEIAAVIVEPVQSRAPGLQPREFLRELRAVTERAGVALVFDEVVTGFRCHPGGAQAYFGVKADLATYGKVIGGGMPIGVLAGKRQFMDALDGGMWSYGDDSFPEVGVTFFAGTFVRHPLAMAAAAAVLHHLKQVGPTLQQTLTERVSRACRTLNEHFERAQIPVRLPHFSGIATIDYPADLKFGSLLWYYLRERGIHVWEGRPCVFSVAHTDEDFDRIIHAFKHAAAEMQEGGLLPIGQAGILRPAAIGPDRGEFPRIDVAPTTEAQKEIFSSVQMGDEANCAYNEASVIHFEGTLNVAVLERGILQLIERHPALRSTFSADGDRQLFHPAPAELTIPIEDLTLLSDSGRDTRFDDLRRAETGTPFDLVTGPLVRLKLVHISATKHALLFTAHHMVCDGWSFGMAFQELCAIYNALMDDRIPLLPPAMSFGDYARMLEVQKTGDDFRRAEEYWVAQFRDGAPVLDLPTDRPRPVIKTYSAAMESRKMASERFARLKKALPQLGGTLFTTLLSAFATLIHRITGQDDVVVGIPAAGQAMVGCSELIGHCLNFLPLRLKPTGDTPYTTFAKTVQKHVLDAYDHQQMTYGTMVQRLKLPRDMSRLPLVSVMFNVDKSGLDLQTFTALEFHVATNPKQFTNFDLFFNLVQDEHALDVECEYNTDLFDRETICAWLEAFEALVESVLSSGHTALDDLHLLGESAKRTMLVEWQGRAHDFARDTTVHELFAAQANRTPNKAAVRCGGRTVSYDELNQASGSLAACLRSMGAAPGVVVGLCVERSVEMVTAVLGILKSGAAYVPLDPAFPPDRLAMMIEDTAMPIIVTQSSLLNALPAHAARVVLIDHPYPAMPPAAPSAPARSDSLAYVIFTSGSTGRPKGVQVPHRAVVNFLESMRHAPGMVSDDVLLSVTTLSFDIAGLELYLPLTTGATVVIASRETAGDGDLLRRELESCNATVMQATPVTWRLLIEAGWVASPQFTILVGGEAVPRELVNQLTTRCSSVWNMYGPTESTIWSTTGKLEAGDAAVSIGRPIDNTQVYVVNARLQPQPVGVPGELLIGGDGLSVGYLKRPDLTAERFIPNPFSEQHEGLLYRTGDLARWRADGTLEWIGRLDFQVKIRGFRVELGEVEATLNQHPAVRESVVVAVPSSDPASQQLAAYVVPRRSESSSTDDDVSAVAATMEQWEDQYSIAINDGGTGESPERSANVTIHSWFGSAKVEDEVHEWIAQTVRQLKQLHPRRVLELGCGAGMVTLRLAPSCDEYWASDFSKAAVDDLVEQVRHAGDSLRHVKVFHGAAHELGPVPAGHFDAVVINSVVEYFPSVNYLLRVINGALQALGPKGFIFLGDVPNFALQRLFHYCRQVEQMEASSWDAEAHVSKAETQMAHDTRLMCTPEFFHALPEALPQITNVQVRVMPGMFEVPATTLHVDTHFDVLLSVGEHPDLVSVDWMEWQSGNTLTDVERWLDPKPAVLGLAGVPSLRLSTRLAELQVLLCGEPVGSLAGLRHQARELAVGVTIDDIFTLAERKDYNVQVCWSTDAADARCDVVLSRADVVASRGGLLPASSRRLAVARKPLQAYASNPLHVRLAARLIPQLRSIIERRLPSYMMPGAFVLLDALPLTPNGKVDRNSLRPIDFARRDVRSEFVAPRTPVEQTLADIWRSILQIDRVGVHDSFFDLGGHSLLAVKMLAEVDRQMERKLPLTTLLASATIERLARAIGASGSSVREWSSLVAIQPQGTKPTLYCVHGAGGNVLLYRELAVSLGIDYPLFGFQSKGLDGHAHPLATIEEMAGHYLAELKSAQPSGPYCLAGYCLGGLVAYQMARLLHNAGDTVPLVALLDTYNPAKIGKASRVGVLLQRGRFHVANIAQLHPGEMRNYLREKIRVARDGELSRLFATGSGFGQGTAALQDSSDVDPGGDAEVQRFNDHAAEVFCPLPYEGSIVLFRPKMNYDFLPDSKMGWGDLVHDGLEVVELPVNPHAMLVQPFVEHLAAALRDYLDKVGVAV